MEFFGRRVIYTDIDVITEDNLLEVLRDALYVHALNRSEIDYLYKYYEGKQPILYREKDVRPEINNTIVVNRANEIVSFKTGYLIGEPVKYISKGDELCKEIETLNDYMYAENKDSKDTELADWFHICGTAYRYIRPDNENDDPDEAPFEIETLDPRDTFVVYHTGIGNKPVMAVKSVLLTTGEIIHSIWTKTKYFEVSDKIGSRNIIKSTGHILGALPIIEYPANQSRLGAFEIVLPLLDSINKVQSNRLDGLEQFVQALMVFKGVDIDSDDFNALREIGAIKVGENGDVEYLIQELNQGQTQTLVDSMYDQVLNICGMPSQSNGSGSDSSNNGAIIVRNGWEHADARAKKSETSFKKSEKEFLKLAVRCCQDIRHLELKASKIDIRFTRRNYENIQIKAQVLVTLLGCGKVHPLLAFQHSGLFVDPDLAYEMSEEYVKKQEAKQQEMFERQNAQTASNENNESNTDSKEESKVKDKGDDPNEK